MHITSTLEAPLKVSTSKECIGSLPNTLFESQVAGAVTDTWYSIVCGFVNEVITSSAFSTFLLTILTAGFIW